MSISPQIHRQRLESPSGLSVQLNANGSVQRIDHRDIILNLFLGNEMEGGPANVYLRRHDTSIESIPLLGPRSPASIRLDEHGMTAHGEWRDLRFQLSLVLAQSAPAWLWHVELENIGADATTVDLIYAQDLALAHYAAVRMNEYYVSQYIDYTPLTHARCGTVLAARQNLSMGGRHPWAVIGALGTGISFATDALQMYGLAARNGEIADGLRAVGLPGKRLQHEHSMAVIQDMQQQLAAGASVRGGFFSWFEEDHPAATSPADLAFVDRALTLPEVNASTELRPTSDTVVSPTLFSHTPMLDSFELTDSETSDLFGKHRRNVERDDDGRLLSFFTGVSRHVVLKAKELMVLRPHGHLIRTGDRLVPDEASLTTTTWMNGVFNSLVTQGHVNINRLLSTTRSYLGLFRSGGQRVFVELEDGYRLLDLPSAYEMTPNGCRWIYKHRTGVIEVRVWAPIDRHELLLSIEIRAGKPCRFLISHHIAINGDDGADATPLDVVCDEDGVVIRPPADSDVGRRFPTGFFRIDAERGTAIEQVGGDELLYVDGGSRGQPFVVLRSAAATTVRLNISGHLIPSAELEVAERMPADDDARAEQFWHDLLGPLSLRHAGAGEAAGAIGRLQEILPWLAHNAMIHYLAPRGLEQYAGGGWGTRDVCQGPVELLLALGKWEPLRDLMLRVFKTQNADGDWPQWFMFFERERGIRPNESHGDIVFWPLLALARYLVASEDAAILDEVVPFFHSQGDDQAEKATMWGHVERALMIIGERVIPGTNLAVYGHGDWNDSLQPVDPAMCERLCSAWTVTLHYQMLTALAAALDGAGRAQQAALLRQQALRIADDFRRVFIVDGTIAGYAYFREDGGIDYLLHPNDRNTGIRFSLLPMMHAILNGQLTPADASAHLKLIEGHLLAADGARLFDRPFDYRGGPQRYFQRAESSAFFGREVGIMYMHAHLRYAETMAYCGDAQALLRALLQATPCGVRAVVPQARPRQANCYYSSSDACFGDRYEALSDYAKVKTGGVDFEGGWRIYSSGAGIVVRLIRECFLGIRLAKSVLTVDPVIPPALDGLRADVELAGRQVSIVYRVAALGHGPTKLAVNGTNLPFRRESNPYRTGGALVSMTALSALLTDGENTLDVQLQ